MKKTLIFAAFLTFAATVSAQSLPSATSIKKSTQEVVTKEKMTTNDQIKKALLNDEDLQTAAIGHLKSNPDTAASIANIATENDGAMSGMMKSILGDKKLAAIAIDYIAKNPKLLEKAMKIVGM